MPETPPPNLHLDPSGGTAEVYSWEPKTEREAMEKEMMQAQIKHTRAETAFMEKQEQFLQTQQSHTIEQTNINRAIKKLTAVMALAAIIEAYGVFKGCGEEPERSITVLVQQAPQPQAVSKGQAAPNLPKDSTKDSSIKKK